MLAGEGGALAGVGWGAWVVSEACECSAAGGDYVGSGVLSDVYAVDGYVVSYGEGSDCVVVASDDAVSLFVGVDSGD